MITLILRKKHILIFLIAVCLIAKNQTTVNAANPVKIVTGHKSDYSILIDVNADPVELFSASELQRYIELITGLQLLITNNADNQPYIAVGKPDFSSLKPETGNVDWDDSYSIRFSGSNILIGGLQPRGTLYGVYEFLERLGCRWYSPAIKELEPFAEKIPRLDDLSIEPLNIEVKPLMKYRKRDSDVGSRTFSPETWPAVIDWAAKQRSNIIAVSLKGYEKNREIIVREVKKRGMALMAGQHDVMKTFLPDEKYFSEHPDWYGFLEGKRTTHANGREVVFETADSNAVNTFTANFISYLKEHPEIDIFQLWPPDVAFWSESPESLVMGTPAERMASLVQKITIDVRNAGLKTRIAFLAYSYYTDPPVNMSFANDALVEFCPINQNFNYTLSSPSDKVNKEYYDQLRNWNSSFPGEIIHYSYYAKYSWRSLPVVLPLQIASEIREWHELGESGAGMYCEPGNWLSLEINHLAFSKASVDPGFNAEIWYDDYLSSRFGKAANNMKEYFALATKISLSALIPQSTGDNIDDYFKVQKKGTRVLKKAAKRADTEESRWIINRFSWQPEYLYLALQLRKSQIDKNEEGEKKFRKMISSLVLMHQGEGTTLDRGYGYKVSLIPD